MTQYITNNKSELIGTLIKDRESYEIGEVCNVICNKDTQEAEFVVINVNRFSSGDEVNILPIKYLDFNQIISNYKVARTQLLKSEINSAPTVKKNMSLQPEEVLLNRVNYFFEGLTRLSKSEQFPKIQWFGAAGLRKISI